MLPEPVVTALADGRDLLYFWDEGHTAPAVPEDSRDLPERPGVAEMRFDALRGDWVAFAAHRQGRTYLPPTNECPLCPSRPDWATEIAASDYDVAVFENRFPSFGPEPAVADLERGLGIARPSNGRCEVVVFAADHDASFEELTATRTRTVVEAWAHRTAALRAMPGIEQVFCFENHGTEIGVTLTHPHGQIYGYPFVPAAIRAQLDAATAHRAATGTNLAADILAFELAEGDRILERGEFFTSFVPYAARMPIEIHLYPNRHVGTLDELTEAERTELAGMYLRLLGGVRDLYDTPTPYISAWHQAPATAAGREEFRLHLEISSPRRAADKLKFLAGSEAAMGAFIGDVIPEAAAAALRATPSLAAAPR